MMKIRAVWNKPPATWELIMIAVQSLPSGESPARRRDLRSDPHPISLRGLHRLDHLHGFHDLCSLHRLGGLRMAPLYFGIFLCEVSSDVTLCLVKLVRESLTLRDFIH